jgi:hypothetical protein
MGWGRGGSGGIAVVRSVQPPPPSPLVAAGYNPRPYQESWHNRLALQGNASVAINGDSYERLVAFRPAAAVDVAVGQVTSGQMQSIPANPPQIYDGVYPVTPLPQPFTYRRTALLVKGGMLQRDYAVLLDATNATRLAGAAVPTTASCAAFQFFQQDGQVANPLPDSANGWDMGNGTLWTFASDGAALTDVAWSIDR